MRKTLSDGSVIVCPDYVIAAEPKTTHAVADDTKPVETTAVAETEHRKTPAFKPKGRPPKRR